MDRRYLFLEDGSRYCGVPFGADRDAVCEIVFNTSMTGYQEILTDPSYTYQAVVMSYPLIGNYGMTEEDDESRWITPSGLIVRDINENPSNFRAVESVSERLTEAGVPGIGGMDTRQLVRRIRDRGTMRALITAEELDPEEALERIRKVPVPHDAVKRCSAGKKRYYRTSNPRCQVAAIDCGMKSNIIRMFNRNHCNVTVLPYDTSWEEILALQPDGVFVSNGPGDPEDVPEVIETLRALRGRLPIFGICLGHQLIALSRGARTYKLKFGHRGGNHPVKDLRTGRIEITSQNHSYAVEESSLEGTGLTVSHVNLLDHTVEGLICEEEKVFSVQYHPESAPGPRDSPHLFREFLAWMEDGKRAGGLN